MVVSVTSVAGFALFTARVLVNVARHTLFAFWFFGRLFAIAHSVAITVVKAGILVLVALCAVLALWLVLILQTVA